MAVRISVEMPDTVAEKLRDQLKKRLFYVEHYLHDVSAENVLREAIRQIENQLDSMRRKQERRYDI